MNKQQKTGVLFDNLPLLSMLIQEHGRLEQRIKNGEGAIVGCSSQKKKDRFLRMVREFHACQRYLERVYLFALAIPTLLLPEDGRYTVLAGIIENVLAPGDEQSSFESADEFTTYNSVKNDGGMQSFTSSYEQLNEDSGLNDFFSKTQVAIQACVCDILKCRAAALKFQ